MEQEQELMNGPAVLQELQARTIFASSDLAAAWVEAVPGAKEYLASGWGLAVELQLTPAPPRLALSVIDPGEPGAPRFPIAQRVLA